LPSKRASLDLPTKYTTVSIPQTLHQRVQELISKKTGFKSVSDYVTYVLREVVAMHEMKETPEPFTSTDIEEIRARLKALGYL
jgi:Arc/MetJ-type ribon-helix-helix transcriptional regulator